jgi:hypothetical protein
MGSRDRRDVHLVGRLAIGFGLLLMTGAMAFVVSVWSVKHNCPPDSPACGGEGRSLAVFLATPVVLVGLAIAGAGWFASRARREKR